MIKNLYSFPLNVFWEVFYDFSVVLPCDVEETIVEMINLLTTRQKEAIYLVYKEKLTYKQAGERLGVSGVCVSHYICKAIHKLRRGNSGHIMFQTRLLRGKKIDTALHEEKANRNENLYQSLDTPISSANLSVRAKNALSRHLQGQPTVGDVARLSSEQLHAIRNVGRVVCEEITNWLKNDYNIELD